MNITYTAESLEDIAKSLDAWANDADKKAHSAGLRTEEAWEKGEATAYRRAAELLRNTKLRPAHPLDQALNEGDGSYKP